MKYIPSSHCWGEWSDEAFADVGMAGYEIARFCRRWGRFFGDSKEKFGTSRFYAHMSNTVDLWELWTGGYVFYHGPKWFWYINCKLRFDVPFGLLTKYRIFIYKLAYKKVLRKYPHIHNEIISGMDHPDLLKVKVLHYSESADDEI